MRQIKARLANRSPLDLSTLDERALMGCIDHSLLRPELTRAEVEAGLDVAIEWETATVCCRPADLPLVVSRLRRTVVGPTTVIGFPHGAHMPNIKEREALVAVDQGAVELDVVVNIGALRGGDLGYVRDELASLVYAVSPTPVKVILETAYLTPEQVEAGCRVAVEARASFVKNGTGYSPRGAEAGEIALMRRVVGDRVGVKAAGGVRTLDAMLAMLAAGACRVGATATATIGTEWRARGPEALAAAIAAAPASAKVAAGPSASEDE
ncbi:MAG: deoxyribose-phosphate aldolase [Candidatus Limnocylindrales bacterium]|jgi:deoxyribose-phosphate aldolase